MNDTFACFLDDRYLICFRSSAGWRTFDGRSWFLGGVEEEIDIGQVVDNEEHTEDGWSSGEWEWFPFEVVLLWSTQPTQKKGRPSPFPQIDFCPRSQSFHTHYCPFLYPIITHSPTRIHDERKWTKLFWNYMKTANIFWKVHNRRFFF